MMDISVGSSIFNEALLFIVIFGTMFIISFFITKRNAKAYELKNPLKDRKVIVREEKLVEKYLNSSLTKIKGTTTLLLELSKLLKNKTINEEEFKILKDNICHH